MTFKFPHKFPERLFEFENMYGGMCTCDGCGKEELNIRYRTSYLENFDLCEDCYDNLPNNLRKMGPCAYKTCDVCQSKIKKGRIWNIGDFDCHTKCKENAKSVFFKVPDEGLIYTDRGHIFHCKLNINDVKIPKLLKDRITAKRNSEYGNDADSLVHVPSNFNIAEWAYMSDSDEVPNYSASCGFMVRCIKGQHQIASTVSDDHGRGAVDIVFDTVEEFLQAEKDWQEKLPSAKEREILLQTIKENFDENLSCDKDLIKNATDSFAVFIRLDKDLDLYYG